MARVRYFKTGDCWRVFIQAPDGRWLLLDAQFAFKSAAVDWLCDYGYEIVEP